MQQAGHVILQCTHHNGTHWHGLEIERAHANAQGAAAVLLLLCEHGRHPKVEQQATAPLIQYTAHTQTATHAQA